MTDPFSELRGAKRWVGWRYEQRPTDGKPTKVPYGADGRRAKSGDPTTWSTWCEADVWRKQSINGHGGGVGIVLGDLNCGLYLCGFDLDSCIKEGAVAPWAAEILRAVPSYAERSPSGSGIKVFYLVASQDVRPFLDSIGVEGDAWGCRRSIPGEDAKDHGPAVECYVNGRYFTVTGEQWLGSNDRLAQLDSAQLDRLAVLIPSRKTVASNGTAATGDTSRSAAAFRMGRELHRAGKSFDEMVAALHADPETAGWAREKGDAAGGREFKRIWEKAAQASAQRRLKIGSDVEIASRVLDELRDEYGEIVFADSDFYRWEGTHWQVVSDDKLRLAIHLYDGATYPTARGNGIVRLSKSRIDSVRCERPLRCKWNNVVKSVV
jgi:putative DNA primase/helicase